jgi:hypothetical protein
MWARVHKVDRIRPQPGGGAIILIEDERSAPQMQRIPSLSLLIAVARVLDAKQVLDAKYGGKGEVRYATSASVPSPMSEAIARAGGAISTRDGEQVTVPAQPASVASLVDVAFSELAHYTRGNIGGSDMANTLRQLEQARKARPLDKDTDLATYWPAVFELAALASELARARGGRWIDVREMPVPFALRFPDSADLAHPTIAAQHIVEGKDAEDHPAPAPAPMPE